MGQEEGTTKGEDNERGEDGGMCCERGASEESKHSTLSEKMYSIWPSSSFRVVVRARAGTSFGP